VFPEDLIDSAVTTAAPFAAPVVSQPRHRVWLNVVMFVITFFTTTLAGAHMMYNFDHNLPFFDMGRLADVFTIALRSPGVFWSGLPFSLTLMTILLAHEFGHYLACVYYRVDATLPFFIPFPTPITGTLGAFIRIRSAIYSKRALFDIGIAGPLAGFVFMVPALAMGLALSKVLPGIGHEGSLQFGIPTLEWVLQRAIFPGVPSADIYLHPIARGAWIGMFATALNLLPGGQLDGGHIVYALLGRSHKWITYALVAILLPMGFFWLGWSLWAALLFLIARRHPPVYDPTDIGTPRIKLGILALIVFVLCFSPTPMIG
jgi:membrane-associated protease RseP (regulator of RpoE activity)